MKYISKLLVLLAIVTMATACKDDINEVNHPLMVTSPLCLLFLVALLLCL